MTGWVRHLDLVNAEMENVARDLAMVRQSAQDILRLHDGKPWPCKCFHCGKARNILVVLEVAPSS